MGVGATSMPRGNSNRSFIHNAAWSLIASAALAAPASAAVPVDQMIVFGVSYDDVGQFPDIDFLAVAGLLPPPGAGLDGSTGFRLTNIDPATGRRGSNWVEDLARDLGTGPLAPSTPILFPGERTDIPDTRNIDFALAASRTADIYQAIVAESVVVHPLDAQIPADLTATSPGFEQRLASGELSISRRTLFVVNPAGNDLRDATPGNAEADGVAAAENTLVIIERLLKNGANLMIVPTFPPAGIASESSNLNPDGSRSEKSLARARATTAYNELMARRLPGTGGNIVAVDWNGLFFEILDDPAAFGFDPEIDHTRFCYSSSEWSMTGITCTEAPGLGKSSGGDPDDFLFNDGLHPTQALHRIISDYTASILRAPGMIALLPEVALGDARAYQETVAGYQARRRWGSQPEGVDVFATVQGGEVDFDELSSTSGASSDVMDLTIGLAMELDPSWFLGFSLGSQNSEVDIDGVGSEFENSALMGSAFLGYRSPSLFSDLSLTLGRADLENIDRVVKLGSTTVRTHTGDTEADIVGLAAGLGLDLLSKLENTRLGPFAGVDYLDIEVDSYAEQGNLASAMAFGDQDRESLVGSIGIFASHSFRLERAGLEVYGDLSYRQDFEDTGDDVEAVVKNLAEGVHFRMPGYEIDDQSVMLRAGIGADFGGLRCSLYGSYEDNDREATYIGLSLAYDL